MNKEFSDFIYERHINRLVHFTDKSNLDSIIKYGILSINELKNLNIQHSYNDSDRHDNKLDHISLSITNHNNDVLQSFINKGSIKEPIFIYINPYIIANGNDVIFCDRNAATNSCNKGKSLDDFKRLFVDNIEYTTTSKGLQKYNRKNKGLNEPTDMQAEILVKNRIQLCYILSICDSNKNILY